MADTLPASNSIVPSKIYSLYAGKRDDALAVFTGAAYDGYYPNVAGSAFWRYSELKNATIKYDGIVYYNIPLAFDLVLQQVVVQTFTKELVQLHPSRVGAFLLDGNLFVNLVPDSSAQFGLPGGLYQLLYNKDIKLYARRVKTVAKALRADEKPYFQETSSYILFGDGRYAIIERQKDVQQFFAADKDKLQAFWKAARMDFKKDPEQFIKQTLDYWYQQKK